MKRVEECSLPQPALLPFSLGHHIFIAVLNLIAFLARSLNFNRPINGNAGMQEHDPLCSVRTHENSVCSLCNEKL